MSLFRKILCTLLVIGGLASTISAGTYASFSATTASEPASFATGSLVLDREIAATSCFSVGVGTVTDTNAHAGCNAVISQNRVWTGEDYAVDLTLTNAGTLPGTLAFGAVAACTSDANPGVNWTQATGDMCQNTAFVLQEMTTGFGAALSECAYPADGLAACSLTAPATLTANGSHPVFGSTPGLPVIASPQALGSLQAGESRYFRMTFELPIGVSNQLQGRRASFQLTWQLDQ